MSPSSTASDASYHSRHYARSRKRAERIAENIIGPVSVLDVGCNRGVTSSYLLASGLAREITGIELSTDTVSEELKSNSQFHLIEGDIATVPLSKKYDVCIYGAVHHHVMNYHGLSVAVAVLQKLASSSRKTLFFETGHLSEGGRWGWQRSIRRYFRTDEAHLFYLISCIEHLIDDFQIIGRFRIHGIRRWLFKISIKAHDRKCDIPCDPFRQLTPKGLGTNVYGRTFGSRAQRLLSQDDDQLSESPVMFEIVDDEKGKKIFLKRHVHRPAANAAECRVSAQLSHAWAVRCLGMLPDRATIAFPYIANSTKITALAGCSKADRNLAARSIIQIFKDAGTSVVSIDNPLLLRGEQPLSLIRICDFNPNNFLVTGSGATQAIRIVDFEQHSRSNQYRNRLHLSHMLRILRRRRLRAIIEYAYGFVGIVGLMVAYQAKSADKRIRNRQPGILSVAITELRSVSGRLFGKLLRVLRIEQ